MKRDELKEGWSPPERGKTYWSFFLDRNGCIRFNRKCRKCIHSCKQSFRMIILICPKYRRKEVRKTGETGK